MANSYLQSAFEVQVVNDSYTWLVDIFEQLDRAAMEDLSLKERETLCAALQTEEDPTDWGWDILPLKENGVIVGVHISTEESGNIDLLAQVLKAFLSKFDPKKYIRFEWSVHCDKLRADHFYGGGCLVSAENIAYLSTEEWVSDRLKEWGMVE
jgi:hypothetical protein